MLIILSANSSPADWVSILPYITSLHSSSCARTCAYLCVSARMFLLPSFFQITSHFPQFPRRCSRRCGLQVMWSNIQMGRQNSALTEKGGAALVGGGKKKRRKFEKKTKKRESSFLLRIWLRVDGKLQFWQRTVKACKRSG